MNSALDLLNNKDLVQDPNANKYQMNLILRLVSVCIKFPEKCNQNVIVTIKKRSDFWSNLLIISSRDDRI